MNLRKDHHSRANDQNGLIHPKVGNDKIAGLADEPDHFIVHSMIQECIVNNDEPAQFIMSSMIQECIANNDEPDQFIMRSMG